jgi:hypothetical protein
MTGALIRAVNRISRMLPDERRQWVEALTAETVAVPGRWTRLAWVLGGLAVVAREMARQMLGETTRELSRMRGYVWLAPAVLVVPAVLALSVGPVPLVVTILFGLGGAALLLYRRAPRGRAPVVVYAAVVGAAAAVAVLTAVVIRQYPQAASGAGAPLYGSVLALLLAGYVVATVLLTRTGPDVARYALVGGLVSAALWTLAIPAGSLYRVSPAWLAGLYYAGLAAAFLGPPLLVAASLARRTGAAEPGILAGAATGMYAALSNLVGGLVLVLAMPERVPFDSDVLARHHTAADILGANVGEDLVLFIGLLVVWPLIGAVAGAVGTATALARRATTTNP